MRETQTRPSGAQLSTLRRLAVLARTAPLLLGLALARARAAARDLGARTRGQRVARPGVGHAIDWRMPNGRLRRYRVLDVLYPPEAAGDTHL